MSLKSYLTIIVGVAALTVADRATALPVIGGPTFDATTNTGYQGGPSQYTNVTRWVSNSGLAVFNQQLRTNGVDRGYRSFVFSAIDGSYRELDPEGESPSGHAYLSTYSINRTGQVAGGSGRYTAAGAERGNIGVRWSTTSSVPESLGTMGSELRTDGHRYYNAAAFDLNDSGLAVGVSSHFSGDGTIFYGAKPVVWLAGSSVAVELPSPSGGRAERVNNAGVIVGMLSQPGQPSRFGRWSPSHQLTELLPIYPTVGTNEFGISDLNESGNAVGFNGPFGSEPYPMRWDYANSSGQAVQLSTQFGYAQAINDSNTIVGIVKQGSLSQGIRWYPDGTSQSLGFVAQMLGINNSGAVIGATSSNDASVWLPGIATPLSIGGMMSQPAVGVWQTSSVSLTSLANTGFVLGAANFDPDGPGPLAEYQRAFQMMIPQAGTYGKGDANFDEAVDFADLLLLAQNYGQANPTFALTVGDFDLSGTVDFADLLALAQNYGSGPSVVAGASAQFNADWKLARSMVPEPGTLGLLAVTGLLLRRRR